MPSQYLLREITNRIAGLLKSTTSGYMEEQIQVLWDLQRLPAKVVATDQVSRLMPRSRSFMAAASPRSSGREEELTTGGKPFWRMKSKPAPTLIVFGGLASQCEKTATRQVYMTHLLAPRWEIPEKAAIKWFMGSATLRIPVFAKSLKTKLLLCSGLSSSPWCVFSMLLKEPTRRRYKQA